MAYNEATLREKLDKLNTSAQSIENASGWCQFHRSNARRVVEVWEEVFSKADQAKRLAMVYLANDILQNSRKKGTEFLNEFFKVLPRALGHMLGKADEATRARVNKVIRVWDERKVFGSSGSKTLHDLVHSAEVGSPPAATPQQQQQQQQQAAAPAPAGPPLSGPLAQLQSTLQAAAAAQQQSAQLQGAVAAAVPLALGPTAMPQQVSAARQAAQALFQSLQQVVVGRQAATAQLRRLLAEQEAAEAQASAELRACSQHLSTLDARLAATAAAQPPPAPSVQQQPWAAAAPEPAQQQAAGAPPLPPAPEAMQQQQQAMEAEGPGGDAAAEAAALAAALAQNQDSAQTLLQALMALPQEQQAGVGADLAGILQPNGAAGGSDDLARLEMEAGDDLYDPTEL